MTIGIFGPVIHRFRNATNHESRAVPLLLAIVDRRQTPGRARVIINVMTDDLSRPFSTTPDKRFVFRRGFPWISLRSI